MARYTNTISILPLLFHPTPEVIRWSTSRPSVNIAPLERWMTQVDCFKSARSSSLLLFMCLSISIWAHLSLTRESHRTIASILLSTYQLGHGEYYNYCMYVCINVDDINRQMYIYFYLCVKIYNVYENIKYLFLIFVCWKFLCECRCLFFYIFFFIYVEIVKDFVWESTRNLCWNFFFFFLENMLNM